jgi:hypothetical protein
MQLARPEPMVDRLQANPEGQKLAPCNDSVLPSSQIRNPAIHRWTWSEFTAYIAVKSLHVCHGARMAAESAPIALPTCPLFNARLTEPCSAGPWRRASRRTS